MIILTIMGVVVAAITGFVFWQQLRVMAGQLREMQSGGVDTHALALAAESQTTALKAQSENAARLAGFANSQVAKLEALGVATIAQNNVLSGQLETTKLAVDANRNQFQIDQRAWVGLSSFIVQPDPQAANIIRTPSGTTGMSLAVAIILNSGRTPARKVEAVIGSYETVSDYTPGVKDDVWINRIVERTRRGDFNGFTSIQSGLNEFMKNAMRTGTTLADDSMNHPGSGPRQTIRVPAIENFGTLPPQIPFRFQLPNNWYVTSDLRFIVYGTIRYWSVFDAPEGPPKITDFCVYRADPRTTVFSACPVHNDMR